MEHHRRALWERRRLGVLFHEAARGRQQFAAAVVPPRRLRGGPRAGPALQLAANILALGGQLQLLPVCGRQGPQCWEPPPRYRLCRHTASAERAAVRARQHGDSAEHGVSHSGFHRRGRCPLRGAGSLGAAAAHLRGRRGVGAAGAVGSRGATPGGWGRGPRRAGRRQGGCQQPGVGRGREQLYRVSAGPRAREARGVAPCCAQHRAHDPRLRGHPFRFLCLPVDGSGLREQHRAAGQGACLPGR
mmetsp:Transcript_39984/g.95017  ORF Transcript_39984/g.95017 Transcript_39984/m.95017 type:complete len:245 (+) Transcript_39984:1458-2192(+)